MIVCGLDLSLTNAGIAVLTDGRPTLLTSVGHGGKDGASWDQRRRRIVSQSRAVLDAVISRGDMRQCAVDLAVIEGPSYASQFGDQFDRAALWWGVYSALAAKRVPIAVVAPGTLKKWATGKGNAKKPEVLAAAKEWCRPSNHDEADAAWLACLGAARLGDRVERVALTSWRLAGFDAVKWPMVVSA
jgi:Holliday junction resolvasome RuvABC endonuclease subunit